MDMKYIRNSVVNAAIVGIMLCVSFISCNTKFEKGRVIDNELKKVMRKVYLNEFAWGTVPGISEQKDATIIRMYSDMMVLYDKLMKKGIIFLTGEERGKYHSEIKRYIGINLDDLPDWYEINSGYIYWDNRE